ncbi:TPA: hypothetical protein ACS727_000521 [Providencia alcalifaciens]|uniref:hypothetical protein n=1 Tax=Providencia alcalifaciens TaxID=126385 RepID=UPI000564D9E9|nr:hypothetical protein [Providencia alcalifaciens]MTB33691.1 hypothetical protein [Providencia alcalifaciens]MTC32208.1 hypothetical protein [Providencia alcalifaciens]MTD00160.1 hypothetical protein [Providencia alcalifaciens]CAG9420177.1 hypothetical protein NVI2019_NGLDDFDA_01846 [Providencia alcalifaciens]
MPLISCFSKQKTISNNPTICHSSIKLVCPKIINELNNFPMLKIKNSPLSFELKQDEKTLVFNQNEVKWLAEISIAKKNKKR